MKIKLILYILFCTLGFNFNLLADQIFFDSSNLEIKEKGNMIFATKGLAKIPSKNIEVEGDKLIYNKLISELSIFDNVKYFDKKKNIYIESNELIFNQINNTIYSNGKTYIKVEDTYEVDTTNVLYDRNSMKISSNQDSTVNDNFKNIFNFETGFLFNTIDEIISSKKTYIIDNSKDNTEAEKVILNHVLKKLKMRN